MATATITFNINVNETGDNSHMSEDLDNLAAGLAEVMENYGVLGGEVTINI